MVSEQSFLLDKNHFKDNKNFYDVSLSDTLKPSKNGLLEDKATSLGLLWQQVSLIRAWAH